MAIINGRRIDPKGIGRGVHGRELSRHANAGYGRRAIIERSGDVLQIDRNHFYDSRELIDKHGRGVKITSMPDRSKGFGSRSAQSKQIITEQVYEIAQNVYKRGIDFDEDNADWMIVPDYVLPRNWHHIAKTTSVFISFPKDYPEQPPVGFFMPDDLPVSPNGHFYDFSAHGAPAAPTMKGWKWYCVYIHNGAWRPHRDWRNGDNLYTYFRLISEALGNQGS